MGIYVYIYIYIRREKKIVKLGTGTAVAAAETATGELEEGAVAVFEESRGGGRFHGRLFQLQA